MIVISTYVAAIPDYLQHEDEYKILEEAPNMESKLMTVPEVAEFLKLCTSKVYKMVQRGDILSIKIGKSVRLRRIDVIDWMMEELLKTTLDEEEFMSL